MRLTLAILGRPPGRVLFNVKSRTLRVLTMAFCWWGLNIATMAIPLFFLFFFTESKMQELTTIRRQDIDWERTYFGALTYLPHTWSLQNFKCMEFKSPSVVVPSSRPIEVLRGCSWCSSHVRRCCLSIILLDLPLERLATKNTRRKNTF